MTTPAKIARTFTSAGNIVEPSNEDWARAEAFVDRAFKDCSAEWVADHRVSLIRQTAIAEMQFRQHRERKAEAERQMLAA
jgi:hypothetical protein